MKRIINKWKLMKWCINISYTDNMKFKIITVMVQVKTTFYLITFMGLFFVVSEK